MNYAARLSNRVRAHGVGRTLRHVFTAVLPKLYIDLRYGGRYCRDLPDLNKETGQHALIHSNLADLRYMFDHIEIHPSDLLVDVGCGAGRVLNYWLSLGLSNTMIGIELNEDVARRSAIAYRKCKNITILRGDAAEIAAECGGTLFYLFNPFPHDAVVRFEQGIRGKPVRILYYNCVHLQPFENAHWHIAHVPRAYADYPMAIIASTTPALPI